MKNDLRKTRTALRGNLLAYQLTTTRQHLKSKGIVDNMNASHQLVRRLLMITVLTRIFVNSTPCLLADYEERPKEDESSNGEFAGIPINNDEVTLKEQGHRRQDERRTSAGKTYGS